MGNGYTYYPTVPYGTYGYRWQDHSYQYNRSHPSYLAYPAQWNTAPYAPDPDAWPYRRQKTVRSDRADHSRVLPQIEQTNLPKETKDKLKEIAERVKFDVLRDTPIRYLGYSNELVEAWEDVLNSLLGKRLGRWIYKGAWKIADLYLAVDIIDKGRKAYELAEGQPESVRIQNCLIEAGGAGLFQFFANYLIPPLIIRYLRKGTNLLMSKGLLSKLIPKNKLTTIWLPAAVATAITPFIARPLDRIVDKTLEMTYWPVVNHMFQRPKDLRLVEESIFWHHMKKNVVPVPKM